MHIFGFFGGNFSWLAKRGSRLVARGSGSQARKIASPVGFQNAPPFLSFFVSVQFQSPPMIIFVISDLSMIQLFNSWINSN